MSEDTNQWTCEGCALLYKTEGNYAIQHILWQLGHIGQTPAVPECSVHLCIDPEGHQGPHRYNPATPAKLDCPEHGANCVGEECCCSDKHPAPKPPESALTEFRNLIRSVGLYGAVSPAACERVESLIEAESKAHAELRGAHLRWCAHYEELRQLSVKEVDQLKGERNQLVSDRNAAVTRAEQFGAWRSPSQEAELRKELLAVAEERDVLHAQRDAAIKVVTGLIDEMDNFIEAIMSGNGYSYSVGQGWLPFAQQVSAVRNKAAQAIKALKGE